MAHDFLETLAARSLGSGGRGVSSADLLRVLSDPQLPWLDIVQAAGRVREHHFGREVQVHVLNNAQNGMCPEDCSYCSQAKTSTADIEPYTLKPEAEVLAEAERASAAVAHRYCMVFSGRGPTDKRTEKLAGYVRSIKRSFPGLEVCISAGLLDESKARLLKDAGVDRLNHNLNTSRDRYGDICTTHTYDDRLNTLAAAQKAGLQTCSGLIVGMRESHAELVGLAETLRDLGADSIPVNFLLPFEGAALNIDGGSESGGEALSPGYCLRVLSLFRFANPAADVRCAAGREFHLRGLEAMCLYPANSIFLDGYLNSRGAERERAYQMIVDAGFTLSASHSADGLLADARRERQANDAARLQPLTLNGVGDGADGADSVRPAIKSRSELRPAAPER